MAEPSPRSIRRSARSLPIIAACAAAVSTMLFALRTRADLGSVGETVALALVPMTFLIAGGSAWLTARAARTAVATRVIVRFWRLVAASHVAIAVGGFGIAVDLADGGTIGTASMVPTIGGCVLLMVAVLSIPLPGRPRGNAATVVDLAIVVGSGTMAALFLVNEFDATGNGSTDIRWLQTCILVAALCAVLTVAKVALYGTRPIDPAAMTFMSGATVLGTVVAGGLALLATESGLEPVHIGVPLAGIGFALAAERQRIALERGMPATPPHRPYSLMPYVALVLFNAVLVYAVLTGSAHTGALLVGSVVLTALVVGRQIAAFRDNARLVRRLDASLYDVRRQEHRFRALVRNSSDIIAISDEDGRATYVSPGVETVLKLSPEELIGAFGVDRIHPDDLPAVAEHGARIGAMPGGVHRSAARFQHADGTWRWLEMVSTNLFHDPDVRGLVTNMRDITETRAYQEELAHQASHDELTGLINRTLFVRTTNTALTEDADADCPERTVVLLVDLDDFKAINDRLGHAVGDALLIAVGDRLRGGVRPEDTVARLGGDEFAVLLRDVEPVERMDIARRIIGELDLPLVACGYELLVRASVGVAPGAPGADAAELLRRADLAMYAVKSHGRGRCVEFDDNMDRSATEHARLAADLSTAIDRNELSLVYQPIVKLPSGELAAVEALVRWNHPTRGKVPPTEFIPVAERTGLIVPLGAWILYESCQQAASWVRELGPAAPARISVNVSARQLIEPDFPTVVEQALLASGLPADRLTVEITETAVFDGGPAVVAVETIRALGIKVALDDFGTGHSSLGLLRTCPVDVLKVDKSFVDGVGQSTEQEAIVTSLSEIGTAMRLQVIAEGVETASQADRLYVLGYRFAQGFHFARPLPAAEVEARALDRAIPWADEAASVA